MLSGDDKGWLNWYDLSPWINEDAEKAGSASEANLSEDANRRALGVAPVRSEKVSDSVIVSASCHRGRKGDESDQLPLVAVATGTRNFPGFTEDLSTFDQTYRIDLANKADDAKFKDAREEVEDGNDDDERKSETEETEAGSAPPKRRRVELDSAQKEALARMLSPEVDLGTDEFEIENIDVKLKPRNSGGGQIQVEDVCNSVRVWNVE